ncbi:prolyl aminopeptidase [Streptomyces sp. NPDC005438]|uniref:prolyl aminopeptidase n=1 Tax=Streptomyces sp. NPDC005438 TaxID=3156880 RepID=UPI0033AA3145
MSESEDPLRYPAVEPYNSGMLEVGDGNRVYWEVSGNPRGKPALVVHGGPGSGCRPSYRQLFDPQRYRVVLFDQRGCGRSTPHASDPATDLRHNTTWHLVADMERLRAHLGVEQWLLFGVSWGSTLLLAYAETHPERVSEAVISAVTTTRRSEIDWLYRGVGKFFPEAWERFRAGAGVETDGDVVGAYARLTEDPDPAVRQRAVLDWCAWEDTVLSTEAGASSPYGSRPDDARTALVRICAHYFSHGAWLEEGALIRDAPRLADIPGVLVHGRQDMGSPPHTAWELSRRWPSARLSIASDTGHLGSVRTLREVCDALREFAR